MQDKTIAQIQAINTPVATDEQFYVTDHGKQGNWYCSGLTPGGEVEDLGMIIHTTSGYSIKRITDGFINLDWFPVNGDGVTDDAAVIARALSYKMRLVIPKKKYKLNSKLPVSNYLNIESEGGEFIFEFTGSGMAIEIEGSISVTKNITTPLVRGSNYVTSATLAASVNNGDMVCISNDEIFNSNYGTVKRGESKEVFRVDGDRVFFSSPAHDGYLANNFIAKIITPAFVQIKGDFTITRKSTSYEDAVIGLHVALAYKPVIKAKFNNWPEAALRVEGCFQAMADVHVSNSVRYERGYGIGIMNATAESKFSGIFADCRHAVACIAGSGAINGVPHHIKIHDVIASGARANAMIDAHGTAGLVEFSNIFCTGGTIEDVGDPTHIPPILPAIVTPGGLNIGCREAIVKGFTGDQLSNAISIRSDAETEYLDVSDVTLFNTQTLLSAVDEESVIKKIIINGVRGNLTTWGVLLTKAAEKTPHVSISNVDLTSCKGILTVGSTFTPPDEIILHNVKIRNLKNAEDQYIYTDGHFGVAINSTLVKTLRLENCFFEGFYTAVKFGQTAVIEQLISLGSVYQYNYEHILFDGNGAATEGAPIVRCQEVKSIGDHFSHAQHPTGGFGAISIGQLYNIFSYVQVDNFTCEDEPYFIGRNARVSNMCIGSGKGSSLIRMARTLDGYEVLSGTITDPLIIRGVGVPEGAVTAQFSALYVQKDAAAVFYKTTNSGDTGWTAL